MTDSPPEVPVQIARAVLSRRNLEGQPEPVRLRASVVCTVRGVQSQEVNQRYESHGNFARPAC